MPDLPRKPTPPSSPSKIRILQKVSPSELVDQEQIAVENAPAESELGKVGTFADTAQTTFQALRQSIAEKRAALELKGSAAQAATVALDSAKIRIGNAEQAAKPATKSAEDALAGAKTSVELCVREVASVKFVYDGFVELQKVASERSKTAANALKPQMKLIGVEKKVVDAFPPLIAKKRRSKQDEKVLSSIEDALVSHLRSRESIMAQRRAAVTRNQEAVDACAQAAGLRSRELAGLENAWKTAETDKGLCEQELTASCKEFSEHELRMTREGLMRFSSNSQECEICRDDLEVGEAVLLGCGHGWYCMGCMTKFVESRLQDGTTGEIPCPSCVEKISEKDLISLLPKETVFRLHARRIEQRAVSSGAIPRACPTPNCPMRQTFEEGVSGRRTCLKCNIESCWLCGTQPYHVGRTCEQHAKRARLRSPEEESFFKWMEETGTRQCPTCNMAVTKEKLEGQTEQRAECHKMFCRNCATKFCFKCLAIHNTDTYVCKCTKNKHGFIDPFTREIIPHLRS
jgi:hypothetical protein